MKDSAGIHAKAHQLVVGFNKRLTGSGALPRGSVNIVCERQDHFAGGFAVVILPRNEGGSGKAAVAVTIATPDRPCDQVCVTAPLTIPHHRGGRRFRRGTILLSFPEDEENERKNGCKKEESPTDDWPSKHTGL